MTNTYTHAPVAPNPGVKGFRTKSAKRRSEVRQERHQQREKSARRDRIRMSRARKARRLDGWWPPTPLPPGQPIEKDIKMASDDEPRRRRSDYSEMEWG